MSDRNSPTSRLVSRLRFSQLQLLVHVNQTGSLRAAASIVNLTQPALSRSLKELEAAFGFPVFARTSSGLVATVEGASVIKGASLLLAELDHVRAEAVQAGEAKAVIRIGTHPFVSESYLPAVLATLTQGEQPVRVELQEGGVLSLFNGLDEGRLDAIISGNHLDIHQSATSFKYETLFRAEYVLLAKAGSPFTRKASVPWKDLTDERWILPARGALMRQMIDDWFIRNGLPPPKPILESETPSVNIRMVAAGVGLSLVPVASFDTERVHKGVGIVRATPKVPYFDVGLTFRTVSNPRVDLLRKVCFSNPTAPWSRTKVKPPAQG